MSTQSPPRGRRLARQLRLARAARRPFRAGRAARTAGQRHSGLVRGL